MEVVDGRKKEKTKAKPFVKWAGGKTQLLETFERRFYQAELAALYRSMDQKGALLMLNNPDPRNTDTGNDFFDGLYRGFHIHTVDARRAINSRSDRRGTIAELIITNYLVR